MTVFDLPAAKHDSPGTNEGDWSSGSWERSVKSRLIRQRLMHDCGVASLAMVAGSTYEEAAAAFESSGLHVLRGKKAPWSSNFLELIAASSRLRVVARRQRWHSWRALSDKLDAHGNALAILKVWAGPAAGRNWHWVVAEAAPCTGLLVRDPGSPLAGFQLPIENVLHQSLDAWRPSGDWLICTNQ